MKIAQIIALSVFALPVQAQDDGVAALASMAFARNCFSPFLTADRAEALLGSTGARVDFYDFDPLSGGDASRIVGRAVTEGTDRRCEVAFDGDYRELAASAAATGLEMEGIDSDAPVPDRYQPTDGTALLGARQLNPARIAVVHVGTRPGPNGVETFMLVERLTPLESTQ